LRLCWSGLAKETGRRLCLRKWVLRRLLIWGRVWYHLLCSEIDAAAVWYEKMIEAREIFAPFYAQSFYTAELRASHYWPKLARMMNLPDSAL
jgi:hypothetical protein